jgi:DNA-directed RNA polymerase specialized sigma24 family protein
VRELRAAGLSYRDIAEELDMSVGSVHKAMKELALDAVDKFGSENPAGNE